MVNGCVNKNQIQKYGVSIIVIDLKYNETTVQRSALKYGVATKKTGGTPMAGAGVVLLQHDGQTTHPALDYQYSNGI
jgi:hypothetical protein